MSRPAPPTDINRAQIRAFADALRLTASMIDGGLQLMEAQGLETIQPQHWTMANKGARDISKFAAAVVSAVFEESKEQIQKTQKTPVKRSKPDKS
jgi:hypothetical protein